MPRAQKEVSKLPGNAPQGNEFVLQDGRALGNVRELALALRDMSEATFAFHANETKNDFAYWVRDVFADSKLTNELFRATTREEAADKIEERLAALAKEKTAAGRSGGPRVGKPAAHFG
jgi:hypothetical protein